jgi:sulfide:quinone oxidoreductase
MTDIGSSKRRLVGAAAVVGLLLAALPALSRETPVRHITEQFAIAGQITPEQVVELKARGFTTIVAMRPDGEGADQPAAAQVEAVAKANGMRFAYIPVSGPITDSQVLALHDTVAKGGKVLGYCRSGNRVARVWSLMEASRPGGRAPAEILGAVKAAGQSVDNLQADIAQRFARRP